ncbi:MAG TPA: hypothetical protein VMB85_12760 [Bryobacteraceae bacterium]|nr:hypothetical protein [Bryobacteraceae bacterium]
MKNFCVRCLLALALAAAPLALRAQNGSKVTFKAPFSFVAGNRVLPPGEYDLTEDSSHLLMIQAVGHPAAAAVMVYTLGPGSVNSGTLNFVRRGGAYYLNTVQLGDGRTVRLMSQLQMK